MPKAVKSNGTEKLADVVRAKEKLPIPQKTPSLPLNPSFSSELRQNGQAFLADAMSGRVGRVGRGGRDFADYSGLVVEVANYLARWIVLPWETLFVIAAWVVAAWLWFRWHRFPHLAITSPEKRCGKTTLLEVLFPIIPLSKYITNISPAAMYRYIDRYHPTLLIDEAQSLSRLGSESSEVYRELLNGGIEWNATVLRCGNKGRIEEYNIYCPKVLALIGDLDTVLADRCLPVCMKRKTKYDQVEKRRSNVILESGKDLYGKLRDWIKKNEDKLAYAYSTLDPFEIENDRMAELLMPLQTILTIAGKDQEDQDAQLKILEDYAKGLEEDDVEKVSPGVLLLAACRDIFGDLSFISTITLIEKLIAREEEPWAHWNRKNHLKPEITPEALASLLRPYGIRPDLDKDRTIRGYYRCHFEDAWLRLLPEAKKQESR